MSQSRRNWLNLLKYHKMNRLSPIELPDLSIKSVTASGSKTTLSKTPHKESETVLFSTAFKLQHILYNKTKHNIGYEMLIYSIKMSQAIVNSINLRLIQWSNCQVDILCR